MWGRDLKWPMLLLGLWGLLAPIVRAGQPCVETPLTARQLSEAAATAERVEAALGNGRPARSLCWPALAMTCRNTACISAMPDWYCATIHPAVGASGTC
ncbi:MAG: hypothetical protein IPK97_07840 [Ahniella sp.]|nr:hypothetical protein [Ahniella sp.]